MDGLKGRVEVVCGCMFSGKSEELIRRLKRAQIAKQKVFAFKSSLDNRYEISEIVSHAGSKIQSIPASSSKEILKLLKDKKVDVVGIDEVQFFDDEIIDISQKLANKGIRIILAGLDQDFRGEPFGPIPKLLSIAEEITKLSAVCIVCGNSATRTQRIINGEPASYNDPVVMIGASETYEARCREHHIVKDKPSFMEFENDK